MSQLSEIAMSPTSVTAAADEAVTKLNAYHGKRATNLLLRLALTEREFIDDRQERAIRLIAERNDAEALTSLATLLQPHITMARREAVANALQGRTCATECVRSILHYEERLWC